MLRKEGINRLSASQLLNHDFIILNYHNFTIYNKGNVIIKNDNNNIPHFNKINNNNNIFNKDNRIKIKIPPLKNRKIISFSFI